MERYHLSDEEIKELLKKIKNGDLNAREQLICNTFGLVYFCLKNKFPQVKNDFDEYVSVGTIGLIKSIDTFDLEKNIKFTTYATRCIINEILMALRKKSSAKEKNKVSYDTTIVEDDSLSLKDMISSFENIEEDYCDKLEIECLKEIVYSLPEREKFIIMSYYGFDEIERKNVTEIGKVLGYSQSYASKLFNRTHHKIKMLLERQGYDTDIYKRTRKY